MTKKIITTITVECDRCGKKYSREKEGPSPLGWSILSFPGSLWPDIYKEASDLCDHCTAELKRWWSEKQECKCQSWGIAKDCLFHGPGRVE